MIRHLFKLVWRRKRTNALVMIEIFFCFFVVFAVVTTLSSLIVRWNEPLGFEWRDVWTVEVGVPETEGDENPRVGPMLAQLIREMRSFPEVIDVAASSTPPYSLATSEGVWNIDGKRVKLTRDEVSDGFLTAMQLKVVRGRWFRPEDDVLEDQPVVIDTDLARGLFGNEDPIGRKFDPTGDDDVRVVGVVAPYRKDGELSSVMNMCFKRVALNGKDERVPRNLVIRLRPDTPADFEETLMRRFGAAFPDVNFRVRRMDRMRDFSTRLRTTPLILGGVVAAFLISMVALGLSGVLWQNVTRRTREIGLRRALGASGAGVRAQIVGEVAVLATLAVAVGVVIVAQLPLLGIFEIVTPGVFTFGVVAALAIIYAITLLCAVYPGWLASRVLPADALRYE